MRIGIITHNYPLYTGQSKDAGNFVFNFAQKLSTKVDKVFVFCPNFEGRKENYKKVPVTWFSWRGGNKKLGALSPFNPVDILSFIDLIRQGNHQIINFINTNQIDICLAFWSFPGGLFAASAKNKLNTPFATWVLGSDIYVYSRLPIIRQLIQYVLKKSNYCFGNSLDICQQVKQISGVSCDFLPTSNSVKLTKIKKPSLSKGKFNFLYVGRLEKVKGVDVLLKAIYQLSQKNQDFKVYMIGTGSLLNELKKIAKLLKIENFVSILGYVENQKVVNGYFKSADALIIPSRSESFPLVVSEALQAALPIIGADVGDIPLFLNKYQIGFIFPKEDVDGLTAVMEKMISQASEIKKSKKKLMLKLAKEFSLDSIVNKFLLSVQNYV